MLAEELGSYRQAWHWVEAERLVLGATATLAASHGFGTHAWQIPWALETLLYRRGRWHDLADSQRVALKAACDAGDLAGQARAHRALGRACALFSSLTKHIVTSTGPRSFFRELGDPFGEATAPDSLGWTYHHLGRHAAGIACMQASLSMFRELEVRHDQASSLTHLGATCRASGNLQGARSFSLEALEILNDLNHPDASLVRGN